MLATCKPRVGHKRRAPAASYLDEELEESCPSGSCQGLQPAQGAAAVVEEEAFAPAPLQDTPASPPQRSPPTKCQAKAPPGLSSAPNPSQAPAPPLPDPAGGAGRESFWATPSLAPPPSSQAPAGLQRAAPAPHQAAPPTPQLPALAPGLGVSPVQRPGCSPGLASLPAAAPGWQCPCWQQPLPRPCQRHPTAKAQQPHVVPPAPAPPTLRLQVMGLDPAWHILVRVGIVTSE